MMRTAAVVGGGLAGITAACELADAGFHVKLLEKRPFLGGRAYSYTDRKTGHTVDNGQHVFLGCCTEYIALLNRLGVRDRANLQRRLRVPVIDRVRGTSVLAAADLPPPLHLLPSLLRFKSLSPREKAAAGWAFSHIRAIDRSRNPDLDGITFADWLREKRQSPNAMRSLWNLITLPTLNGDIGDVNADLALMVFQEGFLRSRKGANLGWSKVGLSELTGEAAVRYVETRGGHVRTGQAVNAIEVVNGEARAVLTDSARIEADAIVIALDPWSSSGVLPEDAQRDPFFRRIRRLEGSPIVNVHLWYPDGATWNRTFATFLNSPVQWAFNKTKLAGRTNNGGGLHLDISLSGANQWMELPNADLAALFTKESWLLLPGVRSTPPKRALVVKQRRATFAARPGVAALRPSQRTPVDSLYLAGDYTDTGWPATMESAVRSGLLAARAAMSDVQSHSAEPALSRVGQRP